METNQPTNQPVLTHGIALLISLISLVLASGFSTGKGAPEDITGILKMCCRY